MTRSAGSAATPGWARRQIAPRCDRCFTLNPEPGMSLPKRSAVLAIVSVAVAGALYACARRAPTPSLITGDAASEVYVAPGSYDEYYAFLSGGYSGQVSV